MGANRSILGAAALLAVVSCSSPRGGGGGGLGDDASAANETAAADAPDAADQGARGPDVVTGVCLTGEARCGATGREVCRDDAQGYYSLPCPVGAHMTATCIGAGRCDAVCVDGYANCDLDSSNGCEVSITDSPMSCGSCRHVCRGGEMCQGGTCVVSCGSLAECAGACVDLSANPSHCGACGVVCPLRIHAASTCAAGACGTTCTAPFGDCDGSAVTGCETDLRTSAPHCGGCGRACTAGQTCVAGACSGRPTVTARSCRELLAMVPGTASGVYRIDPDGAGAIAGFDVYCEMTTAGGGWTLAAVITNNDAVQWGPSSAAWVSGTTFGDATSVTANADAKSAAYNSVAADEVMIARAGAAVTVEVRTATGCLQNRTLLAMMMRSSVFSVNCAQSCATVVQTGLAWRAGAPCVSAGLRFRCRDEAASIAAAGGYLISTDDNSFMTALNNSNSCNAYQMGLGVSAAGSPVDFDSDPAQTVSATDLVQRLLYVR